MADVTELKNLIDAYGVAVRAGAMTPCKEDEVYFRAQFGIPAMPESVSRDWAASDGTRHPITTRSGLEQDFESAPPQGSDETGETNE